MNKEKIQPKIKQKTKRVNAEKKLKPLKIFEKNGLGVIKTFQRCVSKKKLSKGDLRSRLCCEKISQEKK